jgi:outer membrane lipoprotein-sorting protein
MKGIAAMVLASALVAAPVAGQAAQRPTAEAAVTRAARIYQGLSSFQADFRQRIDDPMVDHAESRGRLYQSGPSRFAMRFTDPAGGAIVMDGSAVWVYLPEDAPNQVLKYPPPGGATYQQNPLGYLLDRPMEKYRATWLREEPIEGKIADVLLLEPLRGDLGFRRATLWLDRESGLPRKVELDERLLTRTLTLSRVRTNSTVPASIYVFRVPDGVKVVEQ